MLLAEEGSMRAYSLDLRQRIVDAVDSGQPKPAAAKRFGVSARTVTRYLAQRQATGDLAPRSSPGRPRSMGVAQEPQLRRQLQAQPAATLAEQCARWERDTGVRASTATMSRMIARLGWTRKKGRWQPASATPPRGLPGGPRH
jgi:transposase